MAMLTYSKAERIRLKASSDFDENWLQSRIADDPSILGLGDLGLIERERVQGNAGRLDLLLSDAEAGRRYEVELMLGATDASHLIRTIEYWDIERRRYPAYDHVAVLVAEDVTSRFLNVMALFSGSIPLIAIQLEALRIEDKIVLSFVKVLDQTELRVDDEEEAVNATPVDRAYWEAKASAETVAMADDILKMVNAAATRQYALNYNKRFIGLSDGGRSRNIVRQLPRKKHLRVAIRVSGGEHWLEGLEECGIEGKVNRTGRLILNLTKNTLELSQNALAEIIHAAVREHEE